jgi:ribose transport system substrate-binding protein
MSKSSRRSWWAAILSTGALLLGACTTSSSNGGSGSSGNSGGANTSNTFGRAYGYSAAVAATQKAFANTSKVPDSTSRPAAKGKYVVVISSGQASISSSVPSDAAVAAAQAIGWKVTLLDAALNPANYGNLIRQAVSLGANGIVLDAIDCNAAEEPIKEAKARGIAIVGIYDYDCNDPAEAAGPAQFSGVINFDNLPAKSLGAFAESYGRDQANYIIDSSHNKARILLLNDPEFTVLKYTAAGFEDQIKHSGGAKVVDTLNFTTADLGAKLTQEIQAELLKHPEVTWIKSPYTYATTLSVEQAIANQPGRYDVMGGEGYQPELDAIRTGKITAVNYIDSNWVGWAAIDTMNSIFTHVPIRPSGIGWVLIDATHNLPSSGPYQDPVDFMSAYKKAWGVG